MTNTQIDGYLNFLLHFLWVVTGIIVIAFAIALIVCIDKKDKKTIHGILVCLAILFGFCGYYTNSIKKDINQKAYVVEHVILKTYHYNSRSIMNIVYITKENGEEIALIMAPIDFPVETNTGYITYGKHSKVAIDFKPD